MPQATPISGCRQDSALDVLVVAMFVHHVRESADRAGSGQSTTAYILGSLATLLLPQDTEATIASSKICAFLQVI
jgi:hypothetical protein